MRLFYFMYPTLGYTWCFVASHTYAVGLYMELYRSLPATAALRYVAKQLKTVLLIFN